MRSEPLHGFSSIQVDQHSFLGGLSEEKGAIFALTKCMALELAPRIRVNCLVPGSVKTREVIERYDLETESGLQKEIAGLPIGRLGEFEDIIHMVECIIGAKYSTGANFYANGGQYMH